MGDLATGFAPPRAMTLADIKETIQAFVVAAQLAQQAGFSGVEIHAAHGYFINQFLSPAGNQRHDAYGGSFENRTRFLREIYTGIRQAVGKDFIVGLRLSATDFSETGFSFEDCQRLVAECAVIGVADQLKGQRPAGYVVLKAGADITEEQLAAELIASVRNDIGAVADFKDVKIVDGLPKTRSGKILRKTMRQIADGEQYNVPSTIEDMSVLDDIARILKG
ncbi:AMP-binding enzyme [Rothia nasisuis]